jgi:tripartite ATP-independent transporter DctM subunit
MAAVLMVMVARISVKRNFALETPTPIRELPRITVNAFPALLMPVILLFGIYGGATTPTEAAAVAATYAFLLAAVFYRAISLRDTYNLLSNSARSSSSVGLVIGGALIFNYIVASENIPNTVSAYLGTIDLSPIEFLLMVNLFLLLLGAFLDATTILLVIIPIFLPAARELGIDLVHFGVVVVVNTMIGLITPPYGVLLFVINATTGAPMRDMIVEVWPFLLALIVALLIITLVPDLVLWFPRLLGYGG